MPRDIELGHEIISREDSEKKRGKNLVLVNINDNIKQNDGLHNNSSDSIEGRQMRKTNLIQGMYHGIHVLMTPKYEYYDEVNSP